MLLTYPATVAQMGTSTCAPAHSSDRQPLFSIPRRTRTGWSGARAAAPMESARLARLCLQPAAGVKQETCGTYLPMERLQVFCWALRIAIGTAGGMDGNAGANP